MESHESSSKNIKNLLKEIEENLLDKFNKLKKSAADLREKRQTVSLLCAEQNLKLLNSFEAADRESNSFSNKKANLRKALDKEEADLMTLTRENDELLYNLSVLESNNKMLKERLSEAEENLNKKIMRLNILKQKKQSKMDEQQVLNEYYKKYLGIEISSVRENVLKIQFTLIPSGCYIIIDFNENSADVECNKSSFGSVIECLPDINLDQVNFAFKEKKNIYEFLKHMRSVFLQKM